MRGRRQILMYGTAAAVLALDQVTKALVIDRLAGHPPVRVIDSFVQLRYTTNTGGALSLLTGFPWFFTLAAVAIILAIILYARRVGGPAVVLFPLGLLLGGALGNVADRLFRGPGLFHGRVVDFIDVGSWPVFNVADSCVTIGAILLVLLHSGILRGPLGTDETSPERSDPDATQTSR